MPGRLQLRLSGVLCVLAVGISCWLCLPPAACASKSVLIEQVEVQVSTPLCGAVNLPPLAVKVV